jgi:hypothetical protein
MNREELAATMFRGYGVKVGVGAGFFSMAILENSKVEKLWSVDPWDANLITRTPQEALDSDYKHCIELLRPYGDRSQIVRDRAEVYFEVLAEQLKCAGYSENGYLHLGRYLDFVYIDADHTYAGTFLQMCLWSRVLRLGGVLAGHDYNNCLEVRRAVWAYCRQVGCTYSLTSEKYVANSWYIVRK